MIIARALAISVASAAVAGVAVGLASPAQAAPDVTGTYSLVPTNNPQSALPQTWTITSCGADCVHVVSSQPGEGELHLAKGLWTGSQSLKHGALCSDGSWMAGTVATTVDAAFTSGMSYNPESVTCPDGSTTMAIPTTFTLTKQ
jgi:hypothetical protein